jgi:hypothetical protein
VRSLTSFKNGMEASHNKKCRYELPAAVNQLSIMKYALCLMKTHIEDNDLDDKVKLLLPSMTSRYQKCEKITLQWAITQTELIKSCCMLYPGSLKAESDIMDHWTKG